MNSTAKQPITFHIHTSQVLSFFFSKYEMWSWFLSNPIQPSAEHTLKSVEFSNHKHAIIYGLMSISFGLESTHLKVIS